MKLSIGAYVEVVCATDETLLLEYIGKRGVITGFNTNGETGNTASDPLIEVEFDDSSSFHFWTEELCLTEWIRPEVIATSLAKAAFPFARPTTAE